ncbi:MULTISPECIES: bifunctional nicotinamidase/pyrazinamidase [unclassified Acinetobacter]|uniref:bifunctional nicotinamidase/pyrazinamidase n=1 Tax=unclassified Acinetobacter TaxID=196816 RepID=UPI0035BA261A
MANFPIHANDALIVVDVQYDFCPDGALAVQQGNQIIPTINQLLPHFQHVVLTQDWHPAQHCSFAENQDNKQPFDTIELDYGTQVLWPTHCVQGTHGAELHHDLQQDSAQLIIRKGYRPNIDSYSAFLEADRKTATGLAGYLKEHQIQRVFFVGLATDFCVAWSAMDARHFGFETVVIDDACRAIDLNGSLAQAWQDMLAVGVQKIDSWQILD